MLSTRTVLGDFHKTIFLSYYCVLINSKWAEKVFGKKIGQKIGHLPGRPAVSKCPVLA